MQEYTPVKEGKVREIYDIGDKLIMVATDRISAFDVILKNKIVKKGTVLTQMSRFWFDLTKDIIPNHMISVDVNDMPAYFRQERFDGNSMMCRNHRQRLGQLQKGRHRLRYFAPRGTSGMRQAARAHLHAQHEGGDRRPRREHQLREEHRSS